MTTLGEADEAACAALMKDMPGRRDPTLAALIDGEPFPPRQRADADAILRAAQHAVEDRGQTHGDKHRVFEHAARLWSADLGVAVTPEQVAWCMVLLKRARAANGEFNADDYVDAAGYAGCAGELA